MSVRIEKGDALRHINMTPMIDVVFLLLIFFLVATRLDEEDRQMDIVLPQASEAMPITAKPKELFVNVNREGEFQISGQQLAREELEGTLRQAAVDNPGRQTVIIRADKQCLFEHVVTVMDLCNRTGIASYRVATTEGG